MNMMLAEISTPQILILVCLLAFLFLVASIIDRNKKAKQSLIGYIHHCAFCILSVCIIVVGWIIFWRPINVLFHYSNLNTFDDVFTHLKGDSDDGTQIVAYAVAVVPALFLAEVTAYRINNRWLSKLFRRQSGSGLREFEVEQPKRFGDMLFSVLRHLSNRDKE